jgi:hypothetical protein
MRQDYRVFLVVVREGCGSVQVLMTTDRGFWLQLGFPPYMNSWERVEYHNFRELQHSRP